MEYDWTFKNYEKILSLGKKKGYSFLTCADYYQEKKAGRKLPKKIIIMRHDVDDRIGRIKGYLDAEKRQRVAATYFFRVHAKYNLFSYRCYELLKRVREEGHEIGLHTEVLDFVFAHREKSEDILRREIAALEAVSGARIKGVAPHRDLSYHENSLPFVQKFNLKKFGLMYQSYDPLFTLDMEYVNESLNPHICWKSKSPEQAIGSFDKIYIMTHPRFWFNRYYNE